MRKWFVMLAGLAFAGAAAAAGSGGPPAGGVNWLEWKAGNDVSSTASLQRGAANFVNYCLACHSIKYKRWSRLGEDLNISEELLRTNLMPADAKLTDYIVSSFPPADADAWFGKLPPDLSLITRSKGADYTYRFLKGFYVDASKPAGTNNLLLDGASMPAVLSDLEGVKVPVFAADAGGDAGHAVVTGFEYVSHGSLQPEQFDAFVRDTVNFLDYVGDPSQEQRRSIGLWVVLFLLLFTAIAWMLKKEYWKDVH